MLDTDCTQLYGRFYNKITDYDLGNMCPSYEQDILWDYFVSAYLQYKRWTGNSIMIDLDSHTIEQEVTIEQLDLLATGMVYHWLSHILNNGEAMQNVMNTKDFQQFSPEKIVGRIAAVRETAYKDFRYDCIEGSFIGGD